MSDVTRNAFLGGRLNLLQPAAGYRAGIDPVLLAASVPARPGQSVLDLGTGNGVALFCLMARVPGLTAVGVERVEVLADLARKNAGLNGFDAEIFDADLNALPQAIRERSFDHVMMNPPYFDRARGSLAEATREMGRGEDTPLSDWVGTALRRLVPGGCITMVQRIERLPDVLRHLEDRAGSVTVLPFSARQGRSPKLFILQAIKATNGRFRLLAPRVLHAGASHNADGDDYTPEITDILRNGAALDLAGLVNS